MTPEVDIVNTVLNRSALAIAAIALGTVVLTGCTPGGSGTGGGTRNSPSPTKTYTEQDLVKILTTAKTSLQANGTVKDVGLLAAAR